MCNGIECIHGVSETKFCNTIETDISVAGRRVTSMNINTCALIFFSIKTNELAKTSVVNLHHDNKC